MGKTLELAIAILNGAVGDHLARSSNGLATEMSLVQDGAPVSLDRAALAAAHPEATTKVAVFLHGLMCSESVWEMDGGDYGALLARDRGYTPLYVRYNSGLAIADNGAAFAGLLETVVDAWPSGVTEILPVGFSMGGLVTRSACHVASLADQRWLRLVKRAFYVGTPHLGAPLERYGRVAAKLLAKVPDPYARLIADLANLRSDGVKDLGDADVRHEDRARRQATISLRDPRHPVPLLASIRHYLVAGSLSADARLAELFGDVMVPVPSATDGQIGRAQFALPPSHVKIISGVAHMTLAHHPDVYTQLAAWCGEE